MKEIGLEYSIPSQILVLNTYHIEKRSQYAQKYLNIDEKRFIFTNESYFQLTRNKEGCWNFKDEDNFVQMTKQKICFMVWGAISWNDRSEICIRKSGFKFNSDTYIEILDNYLLPFINKNKTQIATRSKKNGFYVVQDNAPCHSSKKTLDHLKQENISFLEHPPNSTGLNAIQLVWLILKRKIEKSRPQNQQQLKSLITTEWQKIDQEKIQNCISHFKNILID